MEIYHLVLCCVLFTTVASFSILDALPGYGNDSLPLDAQSKNCKCENGRCVTDKQGNMKCACKPGYALQDEFTCQPCDCGTLGKCIFVLKLASISNKYQYHKKCVCDVGSAEKNGVCVDCFCGENSACDFDFGERRCYCLDGFSEKDGVCTRCDCGFYGKCEYQNGDKKCECDDGYLELNGMCEECDCGEHGTCSFDASGKQTCQCEAGYSVNDGKCERCDCGPYSKKCVFVDGVKTCDCADKYADRYGTCEECYCGPYTRNCNFNDNKKTCGCLEGYVQKGENCELGCSAKHPCQHGGFCKGGFCFCLNGTKGEFCDEIVECTNNLCPNERDITCAYDIGTQKAYCKCLDPNLRYNPNVKQCRNPCDERRPCENGGKCGITGSDLFCKCPPGTTGDFCEKVPDCDTMQCSVDSTCVYDVTQMKAVCRCHDADLRFDIKTLQCKYACDETRTCRNGGRCSSRGGLDSFCDCLEGTTGDLCEKVPECESKNCGKNARCAYDPRTKTAVCVCNDARLSFDPTAVRCKKTCNNLEELCKHGGSCVLTEFGKFCKCPPGTSGDFCEDIPVCENIDCGIEAKCMYNVSETRAACDCKEEDLFFDPRDKKCKEMCDEERTCKNQGTCTNVNAYLRFCDCLVGTTGDFCEEIPECSRLDCGGEAYCVFNPVTKRADCSCRDSALTYDSTNGKCRRNCEKEEECLNGGYCNYKGVNKFCDCLPGTRGDRCEIVDDCASGRVKCKGDKTICVFDVKNNKAACTCRDTRKEYDSHNGRCKRRRNRFFYW